MSGPRHRLLVLPVAVAALAIACGSSTPPSFPADDAPLLAAADSADSDLMPGEARLMWEAWQLARTSADTSLSDLPVADVLAEEAYTQALLGAEDEAMLLWGEALLILRSGSAQGDGD